MGSIPTFDTALALTKDREAFGLFLESYERARGAELAPRLHDYMLDELLPFLEDITIVELGPPGQATYRLCGTKVIKRIGQEVTGRNMLDFLPPEIRHGAYSNIEAMLSMPCGNYSRYHNLFTSGRNVEAETISLPVRSEAETGVNFLLSLHLVEDIASNRPSAEEAQIGVDWSQSVFFDLGKGTPKWDALERLTEASGGSA